MSDARGAIVLDYHQRTKHRLERYAAGPETLDWDAQPDPFRRYAGAALTPLPLVADMDTTSWDSLFRPGAVAARPFTRANVALLFELSFALSAWKQLGPDRWALRCNPSSGNLHPVEVYLLAQGVADLDDALYHYAPREHELELRARGPGADQGHDKTTRLFIGLSSIDWREAWKYGERAFRYGQLDVGHAIGALRYAAAVLGWQVRDVDPGSAALAALLGLDRDGDFAEFGGAEREEPEALIELQGAPAVEARLPDLSGAEWSGHANRLDPHPMYRWPVIETVTRATRRETRREARPIAAAVALAPRHRAPANHLRAATLIRGRRSAQRFDRRARLAAPDFWPMLAALLPRDAAGHAPLPWDVLAAPARVHAVLFAHRVDGLEPGAYVLPRAPGASTALRAALPGLEWRDVPGAPADLPVLRLAANPALAGTLRTLSCHQNIAADAMFVVAMLAEFTVSDTPWQYRDLLREAGLLGQVLYLEAEAAGLRGTGIGCFFDDAVHDLLGLPSAIGPIDGASAWQVLYHFSVGLPVLDTRIVSEAPYDSSFDRHVRREGLS